MPVVALVARHEPLRQSATVVETHIHTQLAHVVAVEAVVKAKTASATTTEIVAVQQQSAKVVERKRFI